MKKKNFIYISALCALMSFSFTSCGDDEDPIPEVPENPDPTPDQPTEDDSFMGLYFLNSGNMGNNNSSLYMYDIEKGEVVPDYFLAQNGRGLGDTAQDMIVYGDKMYITVSGEKTIEVTDLHAKSIKQIKVDQQPRYMAADGGKVYVSYFNGEVARLDTASLEMDVTVKVGRNPEQMVVASNKLFVTNSGGMDLYTEVGADKTVSVIDLASFTEMAKVEVVLNPTRIVADEQGYVYVVSMGNYADIPNTLQKINVESLEVTPVISCPNATEMAYMDDILYTYYAQYDADWNTTITYTMYNTQTGVAKEWKKDTEVKKPYGLCAAGSNIYVTESDFTNNGDIYAFDTTGKLILKAGAGLNPMKIVLAQKDNI
ncbi:YncE family protein [Parabacteroides sp.]